MISLRKKCRCVDMTYIALLHVYNHILTFTKLATYFASVAKSNVGNYGCINPFIPPWIRHWVRSFL